MNKLSRELPELTLSVPMLINATTQTKRAKQEGFNAGIKHQFLRSQMEYMAFMLQYQQALKRIAELEAQLLDQIGKVTMLIETLNNLEGETDAENASLKEQLAVWLEKCIGCPLCPVPAKEEQ